MASVDGFTGQKILLKIGDGADPEVFTAPVLINAERSVNLAAQTNKTVLPDDTDPDAPGYEHINKSGLGLTFTGAGVIHRANMADLEAWWLSKDPKNVEIEVGGTGGRKYSCAAHCTSLEWTGTRADFANCNITVESSGVITPAAIS